MLCVNCKTPHPPTRRCPSFVTKALVGTGIVGLVAGITPLLDHPVVGIFIRHAPIHR